MDRLAAGRRRGGDQRRDPEVALVRGRRADADRPVGEPDVERILVGGRVDGYRLHVRLVQRSDHAHGHFTAVRDQHPVEHQTASSGGAEDTGSSSNNSCPYSTRSGVPTWIARTIPAASALISFISFIASRMQSVCPGATVSPSSTK